MSLTKSKLVSLYKKENDPKVKERLLLLVIRVREDGQVPFRVVKEMHRSNPWASNWLKRYDDEGIEGLQDRTKSGRPPELTEEEVSYQIKQRIKRKQPRVDYETGGRVNRKEKRYQISLHSHIPHPS